MVKPGRPAPLAAAGELASSQVVVLLSPLKSGAPAESRRICAAAAWGRSLGGVPGPLARSLSLRCSDLPLGVGLDWRACSSCMQRDRSRSVELPPGPIVQPCCRRPSVLTCHVSPVALD